MTHAIILDPAACLLNVLAFVLQLDFYLHVEGKILLGCIHCLIYFRQSDLLEVCLCH